MFRLAARSFVVLAALSVLNCIPGYAQSAQYTQQGLPIVFEANQGQMAADYGYRFHRDGADTFFTQNEMDVVLRGSCEQPLRINFVGGNATPKGTQRLTGHANYFMGNDSAKWISNIPLFSELEYAELYPGISLGFYGNNRELEHDFRVAAGASPSEIALRIRGTSSVRLQPNGDLVMTAPSGSMIFRKPVAYQLSANGKESVRAAFRLSHDGEIRFDLGDYDHTRELVIDPVIVFSTYLGGTAVDRTAAVTTDAVGNVFVTGYTTSTDFPTQKPLQSGLGGPGATNAFVTKLDPTGKTLIYSTYLGGSSNTFGDDGGTIAVDSSGNAIVAGISSSGDFPHAGAVTSPTCGGTEQCYFIASIKPDGSALNYSGLIGGLAGEYTNGTNGRVTVDSSGNAYLAGTTDDPNFAITAGTLASKAIGYPYNETFVLKVDPTGHLSYSTVIPGTAPQSPSQPYTNSFLPTGIAVDGAGRVTVVGWGGLGLPTTSGVVAPQFPNPYVNYSNPSAGVVFQLNSVASAIDFASYLPGTDYAGGLAVDPGGNLWVAGYTGETNLPVSANAYQKAPSSGSLSSSAPTSGYIMELASGATSVKCATYLDGSGIGQLYESSSFTAIALDSKSNVFVGGSTSSQDFPLKDPFVTILTSAGTISGMILAEMSPDLSTVEFGSYLNATDLSYGGSDFAGLTVDAQDHLVVTGGTFATDFPTTPGSVEPQLPPAVNPLSNPEHSFITKIDLSTPSPAVCFDSLSVTFGNVSAKSSTTSTLHVTNCGNAPLSIDSIASSDPTVTTAQTCGSIAPGAICPIQLTFTPVSSAATTGSITLTDNAVTLPQVVSFQGQGIAPKIVPQSTPVIFGHFLVGTQAPTFALSIANQGQVGLTISNVTVSGSNFSLVSQNCTQGSVNPAWLCVVTLGFSPSSAGTLSGAVTVTSNDPQMPQLIVPLSGNGDATYSLPLLSAIDGPTVLIDAAVTETLTGANFYPQSIVQLNGTSLATTYVSGTTLQAVVTATSITSLGEQILTVVNPQPVGGTSAGVLVTPYQTLAINPVFLVSVPATGLLYAAMPSNATNNPNTIIPIDPTTGSMKRPLRSA
jgi:hypothetical protein